MKPGGLGILFVGRRYLDFRRVVLEVVVEVMFGWKRVNSVTGFWLTLTELGSKYTFSPEGSYCDLNIVFAMSYIESKRSFVGLVLV